MTEAPTRPGGRVVAAWWRDLAAWRPSRLWYASLFLHRVEALVAEARPVPLDPVHRALLRASASSAPPGARESLHLDPQLQAGCIRELRDAGLLREISPGRAELTPAGQQALEHNLGRAVERRRRAFYFLDNSSLGLPPHFLHLDPGPNVTAAHHQPFDPHHLRHAAHASPEWKARFRFPAEVLGILGGPPSTHAADWRQVILDRPEHRNVVLVESTAPNGTAILYGFPADADDGSLSVDRPVLHLTEGKHEAFPDLAAEPAPAAWQEAWERWCHALPAPAESLTVCPIYYAQGTLTVTLSPDLSRWLRGLAGDPLDREGWVLAGSGRLAWAARVAVING